MPLSLNQQSDGKYIPENPGTATHEWVKELYFECKKPEKDIQINEEINQVLKDYIQTVYDYKDKRNWEGADQQYRNSLQFAKELGLDLESIKK